MLGSCHMVDTNVEVGARLNGSFGVECGRDGMLAMRPGRAVTVRRRLGEAVHADIGRARAALVLDASIAGRSFSDIVWRDLRDSVSRCGRPAVSTG